MNEFHKLEHARAAESIKTFLDLFEMRAKKMQDDETRISLLVEIKVAREYLAKLDYHFKEATSELSS